MRELSNSLLEGRGDDESRLNTPSWALEVHRWIIALILVIFQPVCCGLRPQDLSEKSVPGSHCVACTMQMVEAQLSQEVANVTVLVMGHRNTAIALVPNLSSWPPPCWSGAPLSRPMMEWSVAI